MSMFGHEQESKPHTTPKDFALWAGAMIALYLSAGALITLLFSYLDILFPDTLRTYYHDPFSGAISFSMASLIILVPIYIWLTRILTQDIRKNPQKKEIGIRRWLLYITLLISGFVLAGDLIALVNNFLGGELSIRFFLKVLVIFAVIGSAFAYYYADLKGYWEKNEAKAKLSGAIVGAVVLVSIISGFVLVGTPTEQRGIRFDTERVNDLQQIQWQVVNYWQSKDELPASLDDLNDPLDSFMVKTTDPETEQSYGYNVIDDTTFELCATFSAPTPDYAKQQASLQIPGGIREESNWNHEAGMVCFERTIDPDLYKPRTETVLPR